MVVNTGLKDGKIKTSIGRAKSTDQQGLLRVSFFWPFYGDYRILWLDDDYQYALVGGGDFRLFVDSCANADNRCVSQIYNSI